MGLDDNAEQTYTSGDNSMVLGLFTEVVWIDDDDVKATIEGKCFLGRLGGEESEAAFI